MTHNISPDNIPGKRLRSVAFHTLGCKLNFAETSTLKRHFSGMDFAIVPFEQKADVYVINTCSVTQDANRDCRKVVRRAQRRNPDAFIAVTGCYAQLEPDEIAAIEGVDLVVGARDKFDILSLAGNFEKPDKTIIHRTDVNEAVDFHHAFSANDRTRAFLKVQDGCDYKCSFCTIPLARGKSRSPSISDVLANARSVIDDGYHEIVLTGVNVGDFGRQSGETFLDLLYQLDRLPGLDRIRISSIEPNLLSDDIITFVAQSDTVQPHFHLPLQSGSDEVLQIMKRRYRTDLYRRRVESIINTMPHACIGVDVITGHPGETDAHFQSTLAFLLSLPVGYLHVFTYSERPNTTAIQMDGHISTKIRKERTHKLRRISEQKRYDFDSRHLGTIRPVLVEQEVQDGRILGWTDNYIRVSLPYDPALVNEVVLSHLDHREPGEAVRGTIMEIGASAALTAAPDTITQQAGV
jgi:threonylcarbamoyladenosine tRNA methylthiotransferase MtaB